MIKEIQNKTRRRVCHQAAPWAVTDCPDLTTRTNRALNNEKNGHRFGQGAGGRGETILEAPLRKLDQLTHGQCQEDWPGVGALLGVWDSFIA